MSARAVGSAGIIAAGEGSRFRQAGIPTHKPMIRVGGVPLIRHTLINLAAAGLNRAVIILNERERDCADWIRANSPEFLLDILVKSTDSSFESFWRVGRRLGAGRHLITTVDSFCAPSELAKMTAWGGNGGEGGASAEVYLGLTAFVDDEKPLWVRMDPSTHRITELGGPAGDYATAGFYNVPSGIFGETLEPGIASLRVFLKRLMDRGVPLYGILLEKVVDVDSPRDLEEAERFFKEIEQNRS